jgi:hypothetical protein
MLRYTKRVLVAVLAIMAIGSVRGQPVTYPVNRDCNEGYHIETYHMGDFSLGPVSQAGNEIPLCYPNLPDTPVAGGPTPSAIPNGSNQAGAIDAMKLLLLAAQIELNNAQKAADAALAALEKCEQQESTDAANYPDGVEHSPGYTGQGQGFDRHEKVIDKNPCQAQQQAWDAAHERFLAALQLVLHLQQDLQSLQNSQSNNAGSSAKAERETGKNTHPAEVPFGAFSQRQGHAPPTPSGARLS